MTEITKTAQAIITNLGGSKNIKLVTHCVTRLRFSVLETSLVHKTALKAIPGVLGVVQQNGQVQVVVGQQQIDALFKTLKQSLRANQVTKISSRLVQSAHDNPLQHGLTVFADIFIPILPVIVGAGVLLGISNALTATNLFGSQSLVSQYPQIKGLVDMITLVANTAFTYLPVLVAWSATKRFGGTAVLGLVLGLVLINDQLLSGAQMASVLNGQVKPTYWHIFGLKIQQIGYQNSVLAPLLAALILVQVEKFLKKHLPQVLQNILVAPLAIFVAAFLTFLVIGPAANQISQWIADPIVALFKAQPLLAGLLFGLLWEPLVLTGMHYAIIAVNLQMIASTQQSQMIAIIATICMAEAGADLAIALMNKAGEQRRVALSATISSLLGVTEPSMFGVTIPNRYPFVCVMASAGLAGLLTAASQEYAFSPGPAGPLSFVIIPAQYWWAHGLILVITLVAGFATTLISGQIIARHSRVVAEDVSLNS